MTHSSLNPFNSPLPHLSSESSNSPTSPPPHEQVDVEWYLTQQILPPIARLCEPIEGTSLAILAERLGLDKRWVYGWFSCFSCVLSYAHIHTPCQCIVAYV